MTHTKHAVLLAWCWACSKLGQNRIAFLTTISVSSFENNYSTIIEKYENRRVEGKSDVLAWSHRLNLQQYIQMVPVLRTSCNQELQVG
jgi:hypothetical protein